MAGTTSGILAPSALLPEGWRDQVELRWDDAGRLTSVARATQSSDLPMAPGPVVAGMPNLHSHAFQRALCGRVQHPGPGGDFWSWRTEMYSTVGGLTPDRLRAIAAWTYSQMVAAGYTSVVEFHYVHRLGGSTPDAAVDALVEAASDAGIRLTLAPVLYRYADSSGTALRPEQRPFELSLQEFSGLIDYISAKSVGLAVAPHSLRAVGPDDLQFLVDLVRDDVPVHMHVSEQPAEVAEIRKALGTSPIEWLEGKFDLTPRWCLVHGTQATDVELDILNRGGPTLVLCPTTEHDLGDGRFPLERTPDARFGVGTDSQVSVSPIEELRLILYGMRAAQGRRAVLPPTGLSDGSSLWSRATSDAAPATGLRVGRIEAGHMADLVMLDGTRPDVAGLSSDQILSAWVLSGQPADTAEVRVGGRVVASHGTHSRQSSLGEAAGRALRAVREGR